MPGFGSRGLTPAQQDMNLRRSSIAAGKGYLKRGRLCWDFTAQPSAMSRTYRVRLEYDSWDAPRVFVRSPDLVTLAGGRRLPHVYSQRPTRLCLYLPGSGNWHRGLSLAATIVPWTYLWLYYFEDWLATNEWKGGGVHPSRSAPIRSGGRVEPAANKSIS
jgi:hypothetical protein